MALKVPSFVAVRSYLLLFGGLGVIAWEVVVENTDRPVLVVAALTMMGLTVPLHLDEKARKTLAVVLSRSTDPPSDEETK